MFKGYFKEGLLCGQLCEIEDELGSYYGEVNDGVRFGKGVMTYRVSGDRYEGDWVNGLYHGKGKYTFKNGNYY